MFARASAPRAEGERLQKVLAAAGIASRRACEKLIQQGRIRVNGTQISRPGCRVHPGRDRITFDGKRIATPHRHEYYMIHKPRGVITTTRDPHGRRAVIDLLPSRTRLFPVGRLDAQSEGLLLLTNDGALAQALLHPSFRVPRVYQTSVQGRVDDETLRKLTSGIEVNGCESRVESARLVEQTALRSVLELTLKEGRRRQIRDLMLALGHPVRRLVRISFGPLRLGRLASGKWRRLDPAETAALVRLRQRSPTGSSPPKYRKKKD